MGTPWLADYDAAVVFSEQDARAEIDQARRFVAEATALPVAEGWIAAKV